MSALEYTLYGPPRSWSRPRANGGRHFTPQKVLDEQARHREAAGLARPLDWQTTGRFRVEVVAYMATATKADVDNLAKLVLDGIQGVAFDNDNLVERLTVERRLDRDDPRTEVRVWLVRDEVA